MMMMTAKVDFRKMLPVSVIVLALLLALVMLFGSGRQAQPTLSKSYASNDGRLEFLRDMGWEVKETPKESGTVRIPEKTSELFERYNALQLSQNYNLAPYAGKKVMRYVYEVTNLPEGAQPIYATLLIYKDKIIGGDVTDTSLQGKMQGLKKPEPSPQNNTAPTEDAQGFSQTIIP